MHKATANGGDNKCMNIYEVLKAVGFGNMHPEGWQIRPRPPSKLAMEFAPPPRGKKNNDSIVNFPKCKDFGLPYRCRLRILAPLRKNYTLKHEKVDGLKRSS